MKIIKHEMWRWYVLRAEYCWKKDYENVLLGRSTPHISYFLMCRRELPDMQAFQSRFNKSRAPVFTIKVEAKRVSKRWATKAWVESMKLSLSRPSAA